MFWRAGRALEITIDELNGAGPAIALLSQNWFLGHDKWWSCSAAFDAFCVVLRVVSSLSCILSETLPKHTSLLTSTEMPYAQHTT
jgi:hypothetical protein